MHRCNLSTFISDHCFIECSTSIQKVEIAQKNLTYRPIKDIDLERMSDEISINRDLNLINVVKDFNKNLVKALDIYALIITKTNTDQFRVPCFTPEVKLTKQILWRREKVWDTIKLMTAGHPTKWYELSTEISSEESSVISLVRRS